MSDAGTCPRCRRAGGMLDLDGGLLWCENCNVGWTDDDEDDLHECPHGDLWADPCQECEWDAEDGRDPLTFRRVR